MGLGDRISKYNGHIFCLLGCVKIVLMALDIESYLLWKERGSLISEYNYMLNQVAIQDITPRKGNCPVGYRPFFPVRAWHYASEDENIPLSFWKEARFCGRAGLWGSAKSHLRPTTDKNGNKVCRSGHKLCAINYCVPNTEACPITWFRIGSGSGGAASQHQWVYRGATMHINLTRGHDRTPIIDLGINTSPSASNAFMCLGYRRTIWSCGTRDSRFQIVDTTSNAGSKSGERILLEDNGVSSYWLDRSHSGYNAYLFAFNEPQWSENCPYEFGSTTEYIEYFDELRTAVLSVLVAGVLIATHYIAYCIKVLCRHRKPIVEAWEYETFWLVDLFANIINLGLSLWVLILGAHVSGYISAIHDWRCSDDMTMKLFDIFHEEITKPFLFNILKVVISGLLLIHGFISAIYCHGMKDPVESCSGTVSST